MNHDDLIAKLQKLLALAQRGEAGEAVNARELLDKMMAKYGIDEASLTDIRTLRCATDSDAEKELLIVVISRGTYRIIMRSQNASWDDATINLGKGKCHFSK